MLRTVIPWIPNSHLIIVLLEHRAPPPLLLHLVVTVRSHRHVLLPWYVHIHTPLMATLYTSEPSSTTSRCRGRGDLCQTA